MARPKRTAAVQTKAPAPQPEAGKTVVVEYAGKQIKAKEVLAQAESAFKAARSGEEIRTIELYISVEQNAAYYVVNGESNENFKIQL